MEIGAKKAAGVLTELSADEQGVNFVVVGIGVDVNMTADQLPPELKDTATSVRIALGRPYPRARLLARLLDRLESWLDRHEDEGFGVVRARWTSLSSTVGAHVRLSLPGRAVEGRAEGIDEAGHLLVRTDAGQLERVLAGDVEMLRADRSQEVAVPAARKGGGAPRPVGLRHSVSGSRAWRPAGPLPRRSPRSARP